MNNKIKTIRKMVDSLNATLDELKRNSSGEFTRGGSASKPSSGARQINTPTRKLMSKLESNKKENTNKTQGPSQRTSEKKEPAAEKKEAAAEKKPTGNKPSGEKKETPAWKIAQKERMAARASRATTK